MWRAGGTVTADVLPGWFQTYVGLEGAASLIRIYEVQFVHGLLQTEAYAHAVVARGMRGAPAAEIERRVALRLERQKVLVSERAPASMPSWTRPRSAARTANAT